MAARRAPTRSQIRVLSLSRRRQQYPLRHLGSQPPLPLPSFLVLQGRHCRTTRRSFLNLVPVGLHNRTSRRPRIHRTHLQRPPHSTSSALSPFLSVESHDLAVPKPDRSSSSFAASTANQNPEREAEVIFKDPARSRGYEAPNLRKLADKVAAAGYYVVVPDYFDGEPYNPENPNRPIPVWIKEHGMDNGFEATRPKIEACKGVSAIGAIGF